MSVKKNAVTGFVTQLLILLLGLLIPRIVIINYGSDTNGLTNTLTQIFGYLALLGAGIGQATRNALYQPVAAGDRDGICRVLSASRKSYWKITGYYAGIVLLLSCALPFVLKTNVPRRTVFAVVLFEGMTDVVRFLYTENWVQLLIAEGRGYVQANITFWGKLLSYGVKIVLTCMRVPIDMIQFGYFCVSLIQLALYKRYMNKKYKWLVYDTKTWGDLELPDRNAYVINEVAWTVFSSTDMIFLSVLFGTALSSVYSVYNMIYSQISVLLSAVYTSLIYLLGQAYSEGIKGYEEVHDAFELGFMAAIAILMSCCSALAVPFVRLYTGGVSDVDYIYPFLPVLFGLIQIFSWDRYVSGNLSGMAGYAGTVSKISAAEACLNLILSAVLVWNMGLYGITLATVLSLVLKLGYLTGLSNRKILRRSVKKSLVKILAYLGAYLAISVFFAFHPLETESFAAFCVSGCLVFMAVSAIFLLITYGVDAKTLKWLFKRVMERRKGL